METQLIERYKKSNYEKISSDSYQSILHKKNDIQIL